MQEDIRSLLPEALELIRNKLDVLRSSHLDGFERTQLDALQLDVRLSHHSLLVVLVAMLHVCCVLCFAATAILRHPPFAPPAAARFIAALLFVGDMLVLAVIFPPQCTAPQSAFISEELTARVHTRSSLHECLYAVT